MAYIYKITNQVNGKVYIGKTLQDIHKRWNEHCKDSKRTDFTNRPLYKAFNKYGIENFTIEELEQCSERIASERECFWIEQYGSFKNGYNATIGGDGKRYADYDLIYKLWQKGYNIKEIHQITNYDSTTIRTALNENNISSQQRIERGRCSIYKPVAMIDKNTNKILKVFSSKTEAFKFLNKQSSGHIDAICKGKRKTAYGYKWKEL